ncbi:MAG: efflux RND transporter periplasmic adaptor subunit [Defluviitaleaceae bacterium]|nr:efflux RND transporter periplasmic adaptor subunit [Defluviitaleaceae bacterium]
MRRRGRVSPMTYIGGCKPKSVALFVILLLLAGCAALPIEEELALPEFDAPDAVQWQTVTVHHGDVISEIVLAPIISMETRDVLRFSQVGVEIEGVFVANGDEVREGQIIAELRYPEVVERVEEARRTAARLALELEQLIERHEFALDAAEITGVPIDDASYLTGRENLERQIYFHAQEYAYLSRQNEARFVRATADGVVQNVMPFAEGLWTHQTGAMAPINPVVAVLEDPERVFFRARHAVDLEAYATDYIQPGARFDMTIVGQALILETEVIDIAEYGIDDDEHIWFRIVGDEYLIFEQGTVGRVVHVLEEVRDVIVVPSRALFRVGERDVIYVLEDSVRRMRFVETGVRGREYTQILQGIQIGDLVIL